MKGGVYADAALASAMDDQQLYGGTQSALSRTLLLWSSSADLRATSSSRRRTLRLLFSCSSGAGVSNARARRLLARAEAVVRYDVSRLG
jgi:hypothetical protein